MQMPQQQQQHNTNQENARDLSDMVPSLVLKECFTGLNLGSLRRKSKGKVERRDAGPELDPLR